MMEQLAGIVTTQADSAGDTFPFLLVGRRVSHVYNSAFRDLPSLVRKGGRHNPAFIHPADLSALGMRSGDCGTIVSAHGSIPALVQEDATLRRGVIAMSHSFGDLPDSGVDFRRAGSNTSQLTSVEDDFDSYSGIPRMSAIPVRIEQAGSETA